MSYARSLLSRGEEVVHETRQHWFAVIARSWIWIVVAVVALATVIWAASPDQSGSVFDVLMIAAVVGLIVSLGAIGLVLWAWRNQEWLVTTRRVVRAEGILNKAMNVSSLEKINDARLVQSWIGRIFNFGTLDILTAAEEMGGIDGVADFPMIADPVQFKKAMLNQKEILERPELAPQRRQRPGPAPELERPEAMPPRAGSDRVVEVQAASAPSAARTPAAPAPAAAPPEPATPARERSAADDLADTLERLGGLRDKGLITDAEYEVKKREILERM